jgi:hypothetical protein
MSACAIEWNDALLFGAFVWRFWCVWVRCCITHLCMPTFALPSKVLWVLHGPLSTVLCAHCWKVVVLWSCLLRKERTRSGLFCVVVGGFLSKNRHFLSTIRFLLRFAMSMCVRVLSCCMSVFFVASVMCLSRPRKEPQNHAKGGLWFGRCRVLLLWYHG